MNKNSLQEDMVGKKQVLDFWRKHFEWTKPNNLIHKEKVAALFNKLHCTDLTVQSFSDLTGLCGIHSKRLRKRNFFVARCKSDIAKDNLDASEGHTDLVIEDREKENSEVPSLTIMSNEVEVNKIQKGNCYTPEARNQEHGPQPSMKKKQTAEQRNRNRETMRIITNFWYSNYELRDH